MTSVDVAVPPAAAAELLEIRLIELSAKIERTDMTERNERLQLRLRHHQYGDELHFVLHYSVATEVEDGHELLVNADYVVSFRMTAEYDASDSAIMKFATRTVTMSVHPYLRETITSICSR